MKIRVECYSGHRGVEAPRRFYLGQRRVEIAEIVDRWLSPEHRYFKIRTGGGAEYLIRHDENSGDWALVTYTAPDAGEA